MQKLFIKKEEERVGKNGYKSVWDIENNGYLDARLKRKKERKEKNKIAHVLLQKYFQVSKQG